MKCLRKYQWVKLPRDYPDMGKGIMGYWAKLASRAAFRKGNAKYCGHTNPVIPGMWAGGIVGIKSILGVRTRQQAQNALSELAELGYIKLSYDRQTKKLSYEITDWVDKCSGAECLSETVYATQGYGFLCMPRKITERLVSQRRVFGEADAWLDLWCHTTYQDCGNIFSFMAPAVQYGKYGAILTLETLGQRWGWEKTKVWRFFKKHGDVFSLYRLPSSMGCLIFNIHYPTGDELCLPEQADVVSTLNDILTSKQYKYTKNSENQRANHMVAWYSRQVFMAHQEKANCNLPENRVALFDLLTRAYISHGWNCKHCRNCSYACPGAFIDATAGKFNSPNIRGPCKGTVTITSTGDDL